MRQLLLYLFVLANNQYIEMILEPTSCWEALTYCLSLTSRDVIFVLKAPFLSEGKAD